MIKHYAVRYIDKNGLTLSYGYIETLKTYSPGDVIRQGNQTIKIDFEV